MEEFGVDSHKLIYHIPRVYEWLQNGDAFPICVEITPAERCNQRCIFCAFDYLEYKGPLIDDEILKERLPEMASLGVKAVVYCGEGEPLLHPRFSQLVGYAKGASLDAALSTNGLNLDLEAAKQYLPLLTWLRVSINAGTPQTYNRIHRGRSTDFDRAMDNLAQMVSLKSQKKYSCTIGVNFILLDENFDEVLPLARTLKRIGVDYLAIKPYSWHPSSLNQLKTSFSFADLAGLDNQLQSIASQDFSIVLRFKAMSRAGKPKSYSQCLGLPFFTNINAWGDVMPCQLFMGKREFSYGSIYQNSFSEVWRGKQRRSVLERIARMDISECRENCRIDSINAYLWNLKHPVPHLNFI